MEKLTIYIQGLVMGIAEAIPGISGSTLALIMGIYDDFINLLHQISVFTRSFIKFILQKESKKKMLKEFKKIDVKFGFLLLFGMITAILFFANVVGFLFDEYPQYLYAFFFGLILASINIPLSKIRPLSAQYWLIFLSSFIVFFIFLGLDLGNSSTEPPLYLYFVGGVLGISGMVLPGVSGSFILLLLGIYDDIFGIIKNFTRLDFYPEEILIMIIFTFGLIIGFLFFIRLLKAALDKKYKELMALIAGIMLASLKVLWPFVQKVEVYGEVELIKVQPWEIPTNEALVIFSIILFTFILTIFLTMKFQSKDELGKLE